VTIDEIKTEMMAATALIRGGDRTGGRARLEALLSQEGIDPVQECVLSHHIADAQDDPADELAWDLRAIDAALRSTEADTQRHQMSIGLFMPSLHVNLAEDYFKLGDVPRSREHLEMARSVAHNLADDPYGQMIRRGIERMAGRLQTLEA